MLAKAALNFICFLTVLLFPRSQELAVRALLTLLFELLGKSSKLSLTMLRQCAKLKEGSHAVDPFRVHEQVFKVCDLLLYARSGPLVVLYAIL